jgi:DNA recombination protein RmuC
MTRFNETVGSYERSVLSAARRFDDLGVAETPLATPEPLEATIRALHPVDEPPPAALHPLELRRGPAGTDETHDTRYDGGDLSGRAG